MGDENHGCIGRMIPNSNSTSGSSSSRDGDEMCNHKNNNNMNECENEMNARRDEYEQQGYPLFELKVGIARSIGFSI